VAALLRTVPFQHLICFNVSSSGPLTTWKEVAAYLGKGVRTVQRWEAELGLPVRRPKGGGGHIIVALSGRVG
jgi:hypothetical protein